MNKEILHELIQQNRTTCSYAYKMITQDNQVVRISEDTASVGFIYRHIGETMHLFGTFFGIQTPIQNTTMGQIDVGARFDLEESNALIEKGYILFENLVKEQKSGFWLEDIETPFFGKVSKVRLFSHVMYHNAHHAGQISMILSNAEKQNHVKNTEGVSTGQQ